MTRIGAALLAMIALTPVVAQSAEITRVASSFEPDNPFGLFLDIQYERLQNRTKLVRELHQEGEVQDVSELWFVGTEHRLNLDLHLGLYEDFEFRYRLPIVFQHNRQWNFASGTNESISTITNNCLAANGQLLDPSCPATGAGSAPLFAVPATAQRGGLANMTFGLAYKIFNQKKDDTKPDWVIAFDYTAPTATVLNPSLPTSSSRPGAVGDGLHRYTLSTALSRRIGPADPYFRVHYTLPWRGPGWYSNCDDPNPDTFGRPGNCLQSPWTRSETGIRPPHVAGMEFGTEMNAYENPSHQTKLAFDVRGIVTYVSEGRYYNEMSDLFGKLLLTDEYLQLGGQVRVIAYAAEYVHFMASAGWLYNTDHFLTNEAIGRDVDGNGAVDVSSSPIEINPLFDWRTDMVSRRFRSAESRIMRLDVSVTFAF